MRFEILHGVRWAHLHAAAACKFGTVVHEVAVGLRAAAHAA